MDNGKPVGGKWSFDEENRKKLPNKIEVPDLPKPDYSKYEEEVKTQVLKFFKDHPGNVDNRWMPVTRKATKKWLSVFLEERFSNFGFYEDAVNSKFNFMFHSSRCNRYSEDSLPESTAPSPSWLSSSVEATGAASSSLEPHPLNIHKQTVAARIIDLNFFI